MRKEVVTIAEGHTFEISKHPSWELTEVKIETPDYYGSVELWVTPEQMKEMAAALLKMSE